MKATMRHYQASIAPALLAAILALNVTPVSAQLTLSCPIDSSQLSYLDIPERLVFGKKAADWTEADLQEVRSKYLACLNQSRDVASVRDANRVDFETRALPQAREALNALSAKRISSSSQSAPLRRAADTGGGAGDLGRSTEGDISRNIRAYGCNLPQNELPNLRSAASGERMLFGKALSAWTPKDIDLAEATLLEQLTACSRRENFSANYVRSTERAIRDRADAFRATLPSWQAQNRTDDERQASERNAERTRKTAEKSQDDARKLATRAACDQEDANRAERAQQEKDGLAACEKAFKSGKYPAQVRAKTLILLDSSSSEFDKYVCEHVSLGAVVDYVKPLIGKERLEIKRGNGKVIFDLVPFDQIGMRDKVLTVSTGSVNGESFDTRKKDNPVMVGEAMRNALYADVKRTKPNYWVNADVCREARK